MAQSKRFPAWIGIACTWIGAAVGIFAVTAMAAGLKATFTPDMRTVEIFREFLDRASVVAFGLSAALMLSGAWLGRRGKRVIAEHQLLAESVPAKMTEYRQQKEPVVDGFIDGGQS